MKRNLCITNAVLAFVVFCITFGYVFYAWGKEGAILFEMRGGIFLCIYYLILLIMAVILAHSFYYPVKRLIFAALYSGALIFVFWLIAMIAGADSFISADPVAEGILITMTVLSLCISGIYLFAALKKEEGKAGE